MVFIRFHSFVLVLILLLVRNSSARSHQDVEKILASKDRELEAVGRSLINVNKEISDGFPASAEVENAKLRGRKMMTKSFTRQEIVKEGLNEEDKKTSGAAHFVANFEHDHSYREKRTMNVKCRVGSSSRRSSDHHPMKKNNKAIGFAEFSADYNLPRSHPPKNN